MCVLLDNCTPVQVQEEDLSLILSPFCWNDWLSVRWFTVVLHTACGLMCRHSYTCCSCSQSRGGDFFNTSPSARWPVLNQSTYTTVTRSCCCLEHIHVSGVILCIGSVLENTSTNKSSSSAHMKHWLIYSFRTVWLVWSEPNWSNSSFLGVPTFIAERVTHTTAVLFTSVTRSHDYKDDSQGFLTKYI